MPFFEHDHWDEIDTMTDLRERYSRRLDPCPYCITAPARDHRGNGLSDQ